jgi:FAD synthetase
MGFCYYGSMQNNSKKTVLIFGVFDMLHPGHVYFIDQALTLGDELHINLATDEYVKQYKSKNSNNNYNDRYNALAHLYPNVVIHKGDASMGSWTTVKELKPSIIALGHDQNMLKSALVDSGLVSQTDVVNIPAFHSEIYSTTNLSNI